MRREIRFQNMAFFLFTLAVLSKDVAGAESASCRKPVSYEPPSAIAASVAAPEKVMSTLSDSS